MLASAATQEKQYSLVFHCSIGPSPVTCFSLNFSNCRAIHYRKFVQILAN